LLGISGLIIYKSRVYLGDLTVMDEQQVQSLRLNVRGATVDHHLEKVGEKPEKQHDGNGYFTEQKDADPSIYPTNMENYLRVLMRRQPLLRADWDTMDFVQELSVRFISRLARHGLDRITEDHRAAIIRRMAWQLGKDKLRQIQRAKQDCRRQKNQGLDSVAEKSVGGDPLERLCARETLGRIREGIPSADWSLLELRSNGMSWDEIAQIFGGTASAQRMKHLRLVRRLGAIHS
jgi:hypothetical protein